MPSAQNFQRVIIGGRHRFGQRLPRLEENFLFQACDVGLVTFERVFKLVSRRLRADFFGDRVADNRVVDFGFDGSRAKVVRVTFIAQIFAELLTDEPADHAAEHGAHRTGERAQSRAKSRARD